MIEFTAIDTHPNKHVLPADELRPDTNQDMVFYCIKHIPSGRYLKLAGQKSGTRMSIGGWGPPRLFATEQNAKCSLNWWLKGNVSVTRVPDWEGECDESWHTNKVEGRKAEDMRVVQVVLTTAWRDLFE